MGSSDALVPAAPGAVTVRSNSRAMARPVKVARERPKQWAPPEGLTPQQIRAVIGAAESPRDRLLLRTLWATGARVSEVLALRAMDVYADHLVLPNRKNPSRPVKRAFLGGSDQDLPGALLLLQKAERVADDEPLFVSRQRGRDGRRKALTRQMVWNVVRRASERAGVRVLALRDSAAGPKGDPAPVHPHLFRHAKVRQVVRQTRSLPLAQKLAGWSKLQMAYLTIGDDEAREMLARVVDE